MNTIKSISQIQLHKVRMLLAYMSFTKLMFSIIQMLFQTEASFFSFLPLLHKPSQQILPQLLIFFLLHFPGDKQSSSSSSDLTVAPTENWQSLKQHHYVKTVPLFLPGSIKRNTICPGYHFHLEQHQSSCMPLSLFLLPSAKFHCMPSCYLNKLFLVKNEMFFWPKNWAYL